MSEDEKVKQLVEFLAALVDDKFKEKFTILSKASREDLVECTQTLEDWALTLGVSEQKHLSIGKLLGILNDPNDDDENENDITMGENKNNNSNIENNNFNNRINKN